MRPERQRWAVGAIAGATALCGAFSIGLGFSNGDAAVYAAQAWQGDWTARWIHVGWVGLASLLAPLVGEDLPLALDLVTLSFAVGGVVLAAQIAAAKGGSALVAAFGFAIAVLPEASYAEVDVPWIVLLLGAVVGRRTITTLTVVAAIAVSPTALLGLPWVLALRGRGRRAEVIAGAAGALVVLTVASGGAWWMGDRGVLHAVLSPWRSAERWIFEGLQFLPFVLGWGMASAWRAPSWALAAVLAPADVPSWVLAKAAVSVEAGTAPRFGRWCFGLLFVAIGLFSVVDRRHRVVYEAALVRQVADTLAVEDTLTAPWSWGVRIAVTKTGNPYGLCWRVPESSDGRSRVSELRTSAACERATGRHWVFDGQGLTVANTSGRSSPAH